ncbi:heat shock 70 kDa protein 12A-like [Mytilus californianus]|uniref:heat shock 70 kDa protein 12A-like n=1 Tax=Mytilus californianus TaxID=6549 RepID=UPI00224513E9|nr:heat shock 70 kDa protein 12A-like [Mytilus californianus]
MVFHMANLNSPKENALIVVALDFGTTYSGWAYSVRHDFKENRSDIKTKGGWKSGDGLVTDKTPTVVLFTHENKFHSFGYNAESKYAELVDDNKASGWKYFKRFKMTLFSDETSQVRRKISRRRMMNDVNGQKLQSLMVVSECLRFLRNDFLKILHENVNFVELKDIHWVLTVPAIWSDQAKQFMRQAANQAGIEDDLLSLAYEPEAAAIYCKDITLQKKIVGNNACLSTFDSGHQFLVLDCGGGTVDITAYEVQTKDQLIELCPPSGGPWGGAEVDIQFLNIVRKIFGKDVWCEFEKSNMRDCLDILRMFESRKKIIGSNNEDTTRLLFPRDLFDKYKETTGREFQSSLGITRTRDKLIFPMDVLENLFSKTFNAIIVHVRELLQKPELQHIRTILMVGGFSDSELLYQRIKSEFTEINVLRPHDAVSSVLKGAVIFGHTPEVIPERICARTYGIACNFPFDAQTHPPELRQVYDDREMCTDIFQPIVKKGDTIILGKSCFERQFLPTCSNDDTANIDIFVSPDSNPKYTYSGRGDNVKKLGSLHLNISDTKKGKNRPINVRITYESTEIVVTAVEEGTNNVVSKKFDSLV